MAVGICLFLITTVIPVFADIYKGFDHKLPVPTMILITISDMIRGHALIVLIATIGIGLLFRYLLRTRQGTRLWDHCKLRFPIFGVLVQKIALSRFSRTFATLSQSGVPILDTLETLRKGANNVVFDAAVQEMIEDVQAGGTLLGAMERHPFFPQMMLDMVSAGEQTSAVDEMLAQVADHYDREIEATLSGLTALIEPLLILFLGIVVGFVVVAMFLPIFNLTQIIKF
jgi:type IV pilus assembly protein PilC